MPILPVKVTKNFKKVVKKLNFNDLCEFSNIFVTFFRDPGTYISITALQAAWRTVAVFKNLGLATLTLDA